MKFSLIFHMRLECLVQLKSLGSFDFNSDLTSCNLLNVSRAVVGLVAPQVKVQPCL